MNLRQCAAWLAGLWAGEIVCVGLLAAPAAFATLPRADAGRLVGRMFEQDAYVALVTAVVLLILDRRLARGAAQSRLTTNTLLLMGTLFCVVAGYFALLPMMADARAGQGSVSFLTLHAVSTVFFAIKGVNVALLAWRYAAPKPT